MKSFRQKEITELLQREKLVKNASLAARFGVSLETIRRDIDELEQLGILRKVYGGAEYIAGDEASSVPPLTVREHMNRDAKSVIASAALRWIPDGSTVALDSGTTVAEFCLWLAERKNLTVICSDIVCAQQLLDSGNNVYIVGGFLSGAGRSDGAFAKNMFASIGEIEYFVCSCDGISSECGVTTDIFSTNWTTKAFLKKSKFNILLADNSKFKHKGLYKMCRLSDFNLIITDTKTPKDEIEKIKSQGVDVLTATI